MGSFYLLAPPGSVTVSDPSPGLQPLASNQPVQAPSSGPQRWNSSGELGGRRLEAGGEAAGGRMGSSGLGGGGRTLFLFPQNMGRG